MSKSEPVKVLNRILNRLCQIDRYGYFALPVTETEAPGYHSVIEKPMCFDTMRAKIEARQYRTWGAFLADFQLMLKNAFFFNDKKSVVYRIALQLNKEGNERLKEVDVEGRQAIYLAHPGGPAAAAEDEAREFRERHLPVPINPFFVVPSENPKSTETSSDEEMATDVSTEVGYSSFSETESEGDGRGQGCPSIMKMQTDLNMVIEGSVVYQSWDTPCITKTARDSTEQRKSIQRKCTWLLFRMQALESLLEKYDRMMEEEEEGSVRYKMERNGVLDLEHASLIRPRLAQETHVEGETSGSETDDSCEDPAYPGRVHLSLAILEEETTKLTAQLISRQRVSQARMLTVARPVQKSSAPRKKTVTSGEILEPKRSRRDFEHALHHSDSFGTTGSTEKPFKLNITVPNVIEIDPQKAEKWENAKRLFRQRLEEDDNASMPYEVMQALQLSADEGSSEEDISDVCYQSKHQQMELAERERHLCVLGPLDSKRKKLPEKRPKRSTSGFHSLRTPIKRGRNRTRGMRPVGRPPQRRPPSDLLSRLSQPWSLPMTSVPLPVFSCPTVSVPYSMDVTTQPATSST